MIVMLVIRNSLDLLEVNIENTMIDARFVQMYVPNTYMFDIMFETYV